MTHQADLARFIQAFEGLAEDKVGLLAELYTEDAFFKDPFNKVSGHAGIIGIFRHMYKRVSAPKFVVTCRILQDDQAFILWDFQFRSKGGHACQYIHGSSHIKFGQDGKVSYHRDYWDVAEELYEKIPVLGTMMRFLKNRVGSAPICNDMQFLMDNPDA